MAKISKFYELVIEEQFVFLFVPISVVESPPKNKKRKRDESDAESDTELKGKFCHLHSL